jgi:hypothetical protein
LKKPFQFSLRRDGVKFPVTRAEVNRAVVRNRRGRFDFAPGLESPFDLAVRRDGDEAAFRSPLVNGSVGGNGRGRTALMRQRQRPEIRRAGLRAADKLRAEK